ncbi:MAG: hydantoinase/oxoprolinase family protein, partial [Pseudomonadota bacterium]
MANPHAPPGFRLAIDVGGTFTDTVLLRGTAKIVASSKTPTTPEAPTEGALSGAEVVLAEAGLPWSAVSGLIHGTTLATNALIEKRGAVVATITTSGFRDILEIAYERRYAQYAINLEKPDLLVPRRRAFTIGERVDATGRALQPLDLSAIAGLAEALRSVGTEAVAICLLHSYANPAHELALAEALTAHLPGVALSLSHQVSPEAREFDRLSTTIANAYVQPLMGTYLPEFQRRFVQRGLTCPILMMTASGGMTTLETAARLPIRLVESGPAGGAILAARLARETGADQVLSFDMGGTTAKLCLIDSARPRTARSFEIARAARFIKGSGMPVRIPVIEMIEIGAGGGSLASVDRVGRVRVGPESAGADPGPACFAKDGTRATVTDADMALGFLDPARFAEGRLHLSSDAAEQAIARDVAKPLGCAAGQAAFAISEIVDETMAAAARMHAVESGSDLAPRLMIAFGGNGPLHATRVARRVGLARILIPRDPGVGSALGFLFAPVSFEVIRSRYALFEGLDLLSINRLFAEMVEEAEAVVRQGAPEGALTQRRVAFMRYRGQGHEIEIALPPRDLTELDLPDLKAAFEAEYARQFSRTVPGMVIEILNWGLSIASSTEIPHPLSATPGAVAVTPRKTREITCDLTGAPCIADVHDRWDLPPGARILGPALIVEAQTTTLLSADFSAQVDAVGNL